MARAAKPKKNKIEIDLIDELQLNTSPTLVAAHDMPHVLGIRDLPPVLEGRRQPINHRIAEPPNQSTTDQGINQSRHEVNQPIESMGATTEAGST